jgi:tetratricopeptide (TPR) repeat protein
MHLVLMTGPEVFLAKSVTAAYRKDASGRAAPFGDSDGGWITVATLVQHAAVAPPAESQVLLRDAIELSEAIRDADGGSPPRHMLRNDETPRSDSEIIVSLVTSMEHAGALHLGSALLEALSVADRSLSVLELGRIRALLARLTWKLGDLDRSQMMYMRVARLGRSKNEPELIARAANGLAAIMQLRGDDVSAKRWATKGARLARRYELPHIARTAHHGLMVIAAKARDFDAALVHGWAAYELSVGNPAAMDELLNNLGQVLLDVGHPEIARIAFVSVLSRTQPVRVGLPALGGLAGAAARIGDRETLVWATSEVLRHSEEASHPYQIADALTECAAALHLAGDATQAAQCSASALRLAGRFGYRDVEVRAAALMAHEGIGHGERMQLAPRARRVAREIEALNPGRLPDRVVFAAVA